MRKPLPITFDSLFGDFFEEVFGNVQHTIGFDALPCNEYIERDHYVLEIAAAGFSKDEISVQLIDSQTLSILIAHSKEAETARTFITRKIAQRTFRLSKLIPPEYDLDGINCTFKDGLLKITIPPRKVEKPLVKNIVVN